MNSLSRATLAASHLAVLGLGVVAGIEIRASRKAPAGLEKPALPAAASTSARSEPATSEPPYASAWESLKDRPLPRGERLAIQETLLREWSMSDPGSALHAALAEAPSDQDDLLAACSPGILAHRSQAWELVLSHAFGWETARIRSLWIGVIAEREPEKLFPKLRDMPPSVRTDALQRLASRWWEIEDPALRTTVWSGLQEHVSTADRETFAIVAQWLGGERPVENLLPELRRGATSAERRLAAASVGLALDALEEEEFAREFDLFPEDLRAEVAAAALAADDSGIELTLLYAKLVLAHGLLDDLAAAASRDGFRFFAKKTDDPAALLEWAFTLPDDPRVTELYRQILRGAERFAFDEAVSQLPRFSFDEILAEVEDLPPGWQRDQGLAVLAPRGLYRRKTHEEIQSLLEQIESPDLRAEAETAYQEERAEAEGEDE